MEDPNGSFADNHVKTTKYTVLTFIPLNLWLQLHRFANIYFIFILALNFMPKIEAFAKEVAPLPLLSVLALTAIKDAYEDLRRYRADQKVNNTLTEVFNLEKRRYVKLRWASIRPGDFVRLETNEIIPADILLLKSSDISGFCHIETANLDGENNLKQREIVRADCLQVFTPEEFGWAVEVEAPNPELYHFSGQILAPKPIIVRKENLLLRGCILRNTDAVEGMVVYAGRETKAVLNNSGRKFKRSKLERRINKDVIWCVLILVIVCITGALGCYIWLQSFPSYEIPFLAGHNSEGASLEAFINFWTCVIIFQNIIPLPLYVTIEFVKLSQVWFISNDIELYDEEKNKRIEVRAFNIPEDLGQIEYVFCDKTGTLTENKMEFKRAAINGVDYWADEGKSPCCFLSPASSSHRFEHKTSPLSSEEVRTAAYDASRSVDSLDALKSARTDISLAGSNGSLNAGAKSVCPISEATLLNGYESESPDEIALTRTACIYGCKLLQRGLDFVVLWLPGNWSCFLNSVLHVLPFDSTRKCMSIIVRHPATNEVVLFTKGADSVILAKLAPAKDNALYEKTKNYLTAYSHAGLRTLVLAKRVSAPNYFKKLESTAFLYSFSLPGVTGIEDRLQEGVPETLSDLRRAGMKVWVLTGDKPETATSIAYAAKLFTEEQRLLSITATNAVSYAPMRWCAFSKDWACRFHYINLYIRRLCRLTRACVVSAVKSELGVQTLAIGDGANDVNMIQCADVGIGISGQEGMQAVMASDFAISRFRFLKRLLLVHGHWCYEKLARMTLYMFYKDALYILSLFWYQFFNGFSGSAHIDQLSQVLFMVAMTSIPPFILGIFDKPLDESTLMANPELYRNGRDSMTYKHWHFWMNTADAIWQSLFIFFIPAAVYANSNVSIWQLGMVCMNCMVFISILHIGIESKCLVCLNSLPYLTALF
ncbi:unnamed protein product [Schistocephalus solidus]|uniref:Phospholipid-transporting ATPase n=1 Tax=Schistocephalus solidus TaxID=70667 RepID=A0A3P7CK36_SCHSO|nr:unnamed protein product [Schistocephalus solidus]